MREYSCLLRSRGGSQGPGVSTRALDPDVFRREYLVKAPGLADSMEAQDSGMHATDSVDYGVVVPGEITHELDDGATVHLKQGDCVVQNGTRHVSRNSSTTPCVMAFVRVDDFLAVVDADRQSATCGQVVSTVP
ncbi:MAG TPA: cupin domain-containing protein, partial [Gemmatimonas sp.]|nr:cupin domain-containing protein [Gemmatimonas sp.]